MREGVTLHVGSENYSGTKIPWGQPRNGSSPFMATNRNISANLISRSLDCDKIK